MDASPLAIKLTRPGEYGWDGNLLHYLRRLAWCNLFFDESFAVEGFVQLPGEAHPRLVISQPWYRADIERPHPSKEEIQAYMRAKHFFRVADVAYVHEHLDISASDAKEANFIRTASGIIHPIDLILQHTTQEEYQRLHALVEQVPQMPAPPRTPEEVAADAHRFQLSHSYRATT